MRAPRQKMRPLLRLACALGALGMVASAASLGSDLTAAQEMSPVSIVDFAFRPESLQVPVCSTVSWTNLGDVNHTVTAVDGTFDSGEISPDVVVSRTFDSPGLVEYYCTIHPRMTGSILVTAGEVTETSSAAVPTPPAESAATLAELPAAPEQPVEAAATQPASAEQGQGQEQQGDKGDKEKGKKGKKVGEVAGVGVGTLVSAQHGPFALLAGIAALILGSAAVVTQRRV